MKLFTQKSMEESKKDFIGLLTGTQREGMDALIKWLEEESDFFTAPASARGHAAFEGGLLVHSLNVYKLLSNFNKQIGMENEDSLIIAGLLHDVCKTNFYIRTVRNVKVPGERRWEEVEGYGFQDQLPFGHGEKSVYLVMKHIRLTDEEAVAIRWHMGGYDDAARSYVGGLTQSGAYETYRLAPALAIADMYATYFVDIT